MTEQLTPLTPEDLIWMESDLYSYSLLEQRLFATVREREGRRCENCGDWSSERLICYSGKRGVNSLCECWEANRD